MPLRNANLVKTWQILYQFLLQKIQSVHSLSCYVIKVEHVPKTFASLYKQFFFFITSILYKGPTMSATMRNKQ